MNKTRTSSEVKIGLIGIATVLVVIWGINFLKGKNVLNRNAVYYALYDDISGLEASANVVMKGFKIGTVDDVIFHPDQSPSFLVVLEIEKKYPLSKMSIAEIISADLLGTKAIRIVDPGSGSNLSSGDTLQSSIVPDMLTGIMDKAEPLIGKIGNLTETIDSLGRLMQALASDPSIGSTINHLDQVSGELASQLSSGGDLRETLSSLNAVSRNIKEHNASIAQTISNLESVTGQLDKSGIDSLVVNLKTLSADFSTIASQVKSGSGTAGKLIYDDELYTHLNDLTEGLDSLIRDINMHPKKYVQFSLFGR